MEDFNMLKTRAVRVASAVVLTFLFAVSASAYTLVMRSGRRVEIPSQFVLTSRTLTYEVSKGIQVSVPIASIDITETERANNERPGGFFARMHVGTPVTSEEVSGGIRTITNRDLEPSARRRRQSEQAYEVRRKQLGLPTLEEERKRAAVALDQAGIDLEQKLAADQESEGYWRARASDLRAEIAAVDAELRYVGQRLDETPADPLSNSTIITGLAGPSIAFGSRNPFGGRNTFGGPYTRRPNVFGAPRTSSQVGNNRRTFGGASNRGGDFRNPRAYARGYGRQRSYGNYPGGGFGYPTQGYPGQIGYGNYLPFGQTYDSSYDRSALISQFDDLAATRAGLNARWRALEEEARRAGASPGWLRP